MQGPHADAHSNTYIDTRVAAHCNAYIDTRVDATFYAYVDTQVDAHSNAYIDTSLPLLSLLLGSLASLFVWFEVAAVG